jgi:hypothetical protein
VAALEEAALKVVVVDILQELLLFPQEQIIK